MLVQFVRNEIAMKNIGEKDADRFVPYLVTAFFFILFLNLFGLVPFAATATANISVTVMMALFTFVVTQYAAIQAVGLGGYLAHLTGGVPKSLWPLWPIMIPVEFLGLFTKPFALTVRLFANMVAGHFVILALLGLIFALNGRGSRSPRSRWRSPSSCSSSSSPSCRPTSSRCSPRCSSARASRTTGTTSTRSTGSTDAARTARQGSHGSHVAGASPGHG